MGLTIDVRGIPEVTAALNKFDAGPSKPILQKASTAAAKAFKPFVQAAAPRGATGKLRRSVSARQAKRDRPAAVVSARPKVAFYRHFVIRGTKAHGPKTARVMVFQGTGTGYREGLSGAIVTRHVRGTPPRPFIADGYRAGEPSALRAIDRVIDEALAGSPT